VTVSPLFIKKTTICRWTLFTCLAYGALFQNAGSVRGQPDTRPSPNTARPPARYSFRNLGKLEGFSELQAHPFIFRFPPGLRSRARALAAESDKIRSTITDLLGPEGAAVTVVALAQTRVQYRQLLPAGARPPGWAAALAFPRLSYILMGPAGPATTDKHLTQLLAHEYSHVALGHATAFRPLPAWFVEGFADLQASRADPLSSHHVTTEIPLERLKRRFPRKDHHASAAYAQSRDFVAYLYASRSPETFRRFIEMLKRGTRFRTALRQVYGVRLKDLKRKWRKSWRFRKVWVPLVTSGAILWILAAVLMVMGYIRRRRARKALMAGEPEVVFEADELKDQHAPWARKPLEEEQPTVSAQSYGRGWSFIMVLVGAGLTLLTTALLRTIWPDADPWTLGALTGIGVALLFIILWWTGKRTAEEPGMDPEDPP
jgi:hypothetical protein